MEIDNSDNAVAGFCCGCVLDFLKKKPVQELGDEITYLHEPRYRIDSGVTFFLCPEHKDINEAAAHLEAINLTRAEYQARNTNRRLMET